MRSGSPPNAATPRSRLGRGARAAADQALGHVAPLIMQATLRQAGREATASVPTRSTRSRAREGGCRGGAAAVDLIVRPGRAAARAPAEPTCAREPPRTPDQRRDMAQR